MIRKLETRVGPHSRVLLESIAQRTIQLRNAAHQGDRRGAGKVMVHGMRDIEELLPRIKNSQIRQLSLDVPQEGHKLAPKYLNNFGNFHDVSNYEEKVRIRLEQILKSYGMD